MSARSSNIVPGIRYSMICVRSPPSASVERPTSGIRCPTPRGRGHHHWETRHPRALCRRTQKNLCVAIRTKSLLATCGVLRGSLRIDSSCAKPLVCEAAATLEFQSTAASLPLILNTLPRRSQRLSSHFSTSGSIFFPSIASCKLAIRRAVRTFHDDSHEPSASRFSPTPGSLRTVPPAHAADRTRRQNGCEGTHPLPRTLFRRENAPLVRIHRDSFVAIIFATHFGRKTYAI